MTIVSTARPVEPAVYCTRQGVAPPMGVKPAGVLSVDGVLYLSVELHNYGDNEAFNRQHNLLAWIITSEDHGATWNLETMPVDSFTGRLASPHFIQFGRDYAHSRDEYVYASFSVGDAMLLGRVPAGRILDRSAWEFCCGSAETPLWSKGESEATAVFRYPQMTGENHITYDAPLGRYLMGNYGFLDHDGRPRPYHTSGGRPYSRLRSQLALLEAPEPWGPWSLFHIDDDWGTYGDCQPSFPSKWMSADGQRLLMASSGSFDDYNLTLQKVTLELG